MYPTRKIQELTMDLYANIFSYLSNALDWYLTRFWKRALKSFKEDLYEEFKDQISNICKIAQNIRNHASVLGQGAQMHNLQAQLQDLRRQAGRFDAEQERKRMEVPELLRMSKTELAGLIASHFQGDMERVAAAPVATATKRLQPPQYISSVPDLLPASAARELKPAILESAAGIRTFFDQERLRPTHLPMISTLLTPAASRLQNFASSEVSTALSISGSDAYSDQYALGSLSNVAGGFIAFVEAAPFPVISYFCSLTSPVLVKDDETRESQALISLVYALTWQLLELLPSEIASDIDLSSQRFRHLDGTSHTFSAALALLSDMFRLAPPVLYCTIDGLHRLDDKSTRSMLDDFVKLLLAVSDEHRAEEQQIKILITTAGPSRALLRSSLRHHNRIQIGA